MDPIPGFNYSVRDFSISHVIEVDLNDDLFVPILANNPGSVRCGEFTESSGHDARIQSSQPLLIGINSRAFHFAFHIDF